MHSRADGPPQRAQAMVMGVTGDAFLSLLFPGVPVSIFVLCIEAAAISPPLRAPLTAILVVVVIDTADPYEITLLVTSSVVALLVGAGVQRLQARRVARIEKAPSNFWVSAQRWSSQFNMVSS